MQKIVTSEKLPKSIKISDLSQEDRQKLVDVFAWLLKEDKKQGPKLYQINKRI